MKLIVPGNFTMVDDGVYRSALPYSATFPFIETLGLTSMVILSSGAVPADLAAFCADEKIKIHNIGAGVGHHWNSIDEAAVASALAIITDPAQLPALVCCGLGRHRTGTVIGCFRKLQNWNFAAISAEYRRFSGGRPYTTNEQFIETFDLELLGSLS